MLNDFHPAIVSVGIVFGASLFAWISNVLSYFSASMLRSHADQGSSRDRKCKCEALSMSTE